MMNYKVKNNFDRTKDIPSRLCIGNIDNIHNPFFSVVIPTYNRPLHLKQTVLSALNQEGFNDTYEIIVVDNDDLNTQNETEQLLSELNIPNLLYYKNAENLGAAGNWNRCITLAHSNWIVMCHDDDWLKPDCLQTMKLIIDRYKGKKKEIGYIRSSAESYYEGNIKNNKPVNNQKLRLTKKKDAVFTMNTSDVIWGGGATWVGAPTCGTVINKKAAIKLGGYNPDLTPCFDCYLPYHMLDEFVVLKTYYSLGVYRWGENDTYKKETLLGLIRNYNKFLGLLSRKNSIIRFFSDEHYADCIMYYSAKAREANVNISCDDINGIRALSYSKTKLKLLYFCRKIHQAFKIFSAK